MESLQCMNNFQPNMLWQYNFPPLMDQIQIVKGSEPEC